MDRLLAGPGRRRRRPGAANYLGNDDRLAQVKRRYDPDNLFRLNHNIRPEAPRGVKTVDTSPES